MLLTGYLQLSIKIDSIGGQLEKSVFCYRREDAGRYNLPAQGNLRADLIDVLSTRSAATCYGDIQLASGNNETRLYGYVFHCARDSVFIMRSSIFRAALLGLLSLLRYDFVVAQSSSVSSIGTRTVGIDWPRMLGPTADSRSPEKGILTDWTNGKPRIVWSRPLGIGYGNCVVANGRAFQFDRFGDVERLWCLNAETGEEIWKWESPVEYEDMYGYNNGPRASAVVDNDRVYVYGVAGLLACLDVFGGRERWKADLNQAYGVVQNFFGVGSTPCIFEDKVIVIVGGSPARSQSIPGGRLDRVEANGTAIVAFDKLSGKELYRVGNYLAGYSAPIIATMHGKPYGLAFVREGLMIFDPSNGRETTFFPWRATIMESVNAAWPVVTGNKILISETYEKGSVLLDFDGVRLKPIWTDPKLQRNQAMRAHWATPVLHDGFLFGCSGRNEPDADLRCVKLDDGSVQWTHRNRDRTSCLLVDGHLIVLGEHGLLQLLRLNSEKYDVVGEVDLGSLTAPDQLPWLESPTWAPPVLSHGLLYLRGARRLVCLELIPTN